MELTIFDSFKVGAIILYTYVFNMLAPPPEGNFDIEEEMHLPIKNVPIETCTPDQVPLLASDSENPVTDINVSSLKTGKVCISNFSFSFSSVHRDNLRVFESAP